MVTFLMVTNIAMWLLNTLETSRTDSHPTQVSGVDNDNDDEHCVKNEFYGGEWVWPLISHIAMPLAIFYRYHFKEWDIFDAFNIHSDSIHLCVYSKYGRSLSN